jgi:transcriptional regulator with XRE-family HTH domain
MGERLRIAREEEGITRAQLARESGVSDKTLERAEKDGGKVKNTTRYRIVNALNRRGDRLREYDVQELFD